MFLLKRSQNTHSNGTKRKCKLESNITSVPGRTNFASYRTNEPHLRHTHHSTEDAKAESQHGGSAGGEKGRGVPDGDVVFALFEDEVLG